ncbi:hypothetical protein BJY52DRAFT_1204941 [Lactarius psammicola]|nr:hypothetical protein BJY52DRAFT_1204941 [Lactarius psammicola]
MMGCHSSSAFQDRPGPLFPTWSQCDWEFARWAKNRGPTSTAVGELLAIDGLNRIIDNEMPARPRFRCEEVEIGGENFGVLFSVKSFPCLRTLFGDPEFAKRLVFAPECHYQDSDHTVRVFSTQNPGTTVLPIIISSDKTQLNATFVTRVLNPVYLSIGNIPKDLRRKVDTARTAFNGIYPHHTTSAYPEQGRTLSCTCQPFPRVYAQDPIPIESYGENGIAMVTGDGTWYRCHPVLAAVIGDYPEQLPKVALHLEATLVQALGSPCGTSKQAVSIFALADACQEARLKPTYHPFWEQFPYTNIFLSITPDILHQIHQRRHQAPGSAGSQHSDQRRSTRDVSRLPPSHNACSFPRGITSLSKDICRVLMGVVVDLRLPIRAILNFIYISQYRVHTIYHPFWEPADNYNTEQAERLHIDFTKNAYRATNHKDEYPQMNHMAGASRRPFNSRPPSLNGGRSLQTLRLHPLLAIHPSEKGISFEGLALRYRARDFQDALADFIVRHNFPGLSPAAARRRADNTLLPFRCVSVFHKIKFSDSDSEHSNIADVIHIKPERQSQHRALIPGRFDTALVMSASKYRVVQIRVVFRLPKQAASSVFTGSRPPPTDLAYVEWFSPLTPASGGSHGMFRTSRSYHNGQRLAGIIPLADICRSVQLFPVFGPFAPRQWHGSTVLEDCNSFYINPFLDEHIYKNLNVINQNL